MTRHFLAALLTIGVAQTATAQSILGVTDKRVCDTIAAAAPENKLFDAIQSDAMVLLQSGIEAIEYNCQFDGLITTDRNSHTRQIFSGYCEEPGPYLTPKVFVVDPVPDTDEIHVWESDNDVQTVYYRCM